MCVISGPEMDINMPLRLLSAGSNAKGQLGIGNDEDAHTFQPCLFSQGDSISRNLPSGTHSIINISGGANHTLLLLEVELSSRVERQLWACGDNQEHQITFHESSSETVSLTRALSTFRRLSLPEMANDTSFIGDIAAAWQTSYIVLRPEKSDDFILSNGSNNFGALGNGSDKVSSGSSRICLRNLFSETALEDCVLRVAKINSGPRHVVVLVHAVKNGTTIRAILIGWGACRHGELGPRAELGLKGKPVPFLSTPALIHTAIEHGEVVDVATGLHHTLMLHESGRVTALGSDRYGQCTVIRTWPGVVAIGCTWNSSYAVVDNGLQQVLAAGNNAHGQLGSIDSFPESTMSIPTARNGDNLLRIACGSEHVLVLPQQHHSLTAAHIYAWGWNEHGNLGLGHTDDVSVPMTIDFNFTGSQRLSPIGIWAGCGTSWMALECQEEE
jgi:protein ATS1